MRVLSDTVRDGVLRAEDITYDASEKKSVISLKIPNFTEPSRWTTCAATLSETGWHLACRVEFNGVNSVATHLLKGHNESMIFSVGGILAVNESLRIDTYDGLEVTISGDDIDGVLVC
ncbi:hypothetical protein [Posidoniimonas polymericola]|uniref:hypothetical protein n=1 Tax=Posidoniimonas polymericola TaxID=2528002 RepID=UPI0011B7DE37|nr:hypothetical protein [Posidoniimonas polymericola]